MGYTEKLDGLSEEYWLSVQAQITLHHIADNRIYEVDLHFAFDDQRVSLPWLDAAWERIIGYRMYGQQVEVLSQEDSLLQLALHQRRNLGNPLGMKNTLDACLLLRDYAQSLDWEYLLGQARRMRLCCALYGLLLQAKLFLGQPLPENLREHCHVSAAKAIVLRVFLNSQVYLPYGNKVAYLGHHFLLYDNYREPFKSALDIPREQFAISLNMDPHARKTAIFYQLRVFTCHGVCSVIWLEVLHEHTFYQSMPVALSVLLCRFFNFIRCLRQRHIHQPQKSAFCSAFPQ